MKRLTPKEIKRLYDFVIRAVEHGQLQLQAEGEPHKASDGLTYPQFFGTAELGDCSMNGDEGDPTCGVTVTLPAKTLKWLWVRVAESMGGCDNDLVVMVPESEFVSTKYWCAMCGKWGNHGSGTCPQLHSQNDSDQATARRKP